MKSYTDLEQSKKLAEILPLKSADMQYISFRHKDDTIEWIPQLGAPSTYDIPCWSLAALLSVLDFPSLIQNKEDEWEVCVPNHQTDGYIEVSASNPIDACYEMILKLHELNLL